jgi:mRNA interferase YafQ
MYTITTTNRFERSLKLCKKRNYDLSKLKEVIDILQSNGKLPHQFKPHKLTGNYKDCWECHIKPDWLLIWKQNETTLTLLLLDTGTHSDLF